MSFERHSLAGSEVASLSKSPFKSKLSPGLTRDSVGTVGTDAYTWNEESPQIGGSSKGADGISQEMHPRAERVATTDPRANGSNGLLDKAIGERPPSWLKIVCPHIFYR